MSLISTIGDDMAGWGMREDANKKGIDVTRVTTIAAPSSSSSSSSPPSSSSDNMALSDHHHNVATATYSAIHNEQGDLIAAVADVAVLTHLVTYLTSYHCFIHLIYHLHTLSTRPFHHRHQISFINMHSPCNKPFSS